MWHLSPETLARLVDEAPSPEERAHLDACAACRLELEAMQEEVAALAMMPDLAPSPDAWDALERRLLEEGVVRRGVIPVPLHRSGRIAAALLLFVAGTAAGRITAGPGDAPALAVADAPAAGSTGVAGTSTSHATASGTAAPPGAPLAAAAYAECPAPAPPAAGRAPVRPLPPRQSPATFAAAPAAAGGSAGGSFAEPATLDEAASLLRQTEAYYLAALTRYAELTTQAEVNDPVARLAALQSIVMTTQAALSQTPADPVINGAHLTAVAQRDAALRQVDAATSERWH
jgi:hypothetical protein